MTDKTRIAATYDAAADHHDDPALSFWSYFGERLVEMAGLRPGEVVLDVCCGSGASAIPAARVAGRVIGLDLSVGLIALGRAKASAEGLGNVEFRQADFDQAYFRAGSFDAVLCGFGLFFFPDMRATLLKMWRLLRPGGRLAIATWGAGSFEPAHSTFWNAVREVRPDLYKETHRRDRLSSPELVGGVFEAAGVPVGSMETDERELPLASHEDWWTVAMGSSYRNALEQMSEEERARVRAMCAGTAGPLRIPAIFTCASR